MANDIGIDVDIEANKRRLETFFELFSDYTADRVLGIDHARIGKDEGEELDREIGSGFCVYIDGCIVLVTAGHVLRKIDQWDKRGELGGVQLLKAVNRSVVFPFQLDLAKNPTFYHQDHDLGVIILHEEIYGPLIKAGLKVIKEENFTSQNYWDLQNFTLVGFPSSSVDIKEATLESFPSGGNEIVITENRMLSVGMRKVLLETPKIHLNKPMQWRFRPLREELTIGGMSGGPIFGFVPEQADGIRVIGIQSTEQQRHKNGKTYFRWVTAVNAELGLAFVKVVVKDFFTDAASKE